MKLLNSILKTEEIEFIWYVTTFEAQTRIDNLRKLSLKYVINVFTWKMYGFLSQICTRFFSCYSNRYKLNKVIFFKNHGKCFTYVLSWDDGL